MEIRNGINIIEIDIENESDQDGFSNTIKKQNPVRNIK
jgi:hypothetical protein